MTCRIEKEKRNVIRKKAVNADIIGFKGIEQTIIIRIKNEKIFFIAFLSLFIIYGCLDSFLTTDHTDSILLALLDKDEVIGVDRFVSCGGMDLDYEIGLETQLLD